VQLPRFRSYKPTLQVERIRFQRTYRQRPGPCRTTREGRRRVGARCGQSNAVPNSLRWRCAAGSTRMCGRGGAITSRERHGACPARDDGDGPLAAHACAAWRRPSSASASRGRGGAIPSREAGCARRAAMVTGRWRHTHVRPGAGPPPAVAKGGLSRRARRGVPDSRRW
jgi:hypothetical protein